MKNDTRQPAVTLKDQEWFVKRLMKGQKDIGCIIMGQSVSSLQVFLEDEKYYAEFATDRRGGVPGLNCPAKPFDIAASGDSSDVTIRKAVVAVIMEKIVNDLNVANALVEHMKADGKLPPEFESISNTDIIKAWAKK